MKAAPEYLYDRLRSDLASHRLSESPPSGISELELQARVFSGEFGISWRGEDGEKVEVVHFGTWNREPGPDFCSARVVIDGVKLTGDIEIDQDVKQEIAPYKYPRAVEFRAQLPRTETGKLQRFRLRDPL
jgi:acyl-CoA synthetase (AMP-forming)/AMP-acid ligase II